MKKFVLSAFVIIAFIVYGVHQNQEGYDAHVVAPSNGNSLSPSTDTNQKNSSSSPNSTDNISSGTYKDGVYTGNTVDAFYGYIQVKAVIQGGKITDVQFLQYPNDRGTSVMINQQAMPYLKQEAIKAQSGTVDIVSGATDTSLAFQRSMSSALAQAQ